MIYMYENDSCFLISFDVECFVIYVFSSWAEKLHINQEFRNNVNAFFLNIFMQYFFQIFVRFTFDVKCLSIIKDNSFYEQMFINGQFTSI